MARVRLTLLLALAAIAPSAARADAGVRVGFDLYAFSQRDRGGDPFRNEAFLNLGGRTEVQIQATRRLGIWHNATFAILNNSDPQPVPGTVSNAKVLAASGQILYLDTAGGLEWNSEGGDWIVRPGLFYHHQSSIISGGADLAVHRLLAGGDTTLTLSYSLRLGFKKLRYWDGTEEYDHSHPTPSHTILVGLTQTLSPSWRLVLNAIYARQTGVLSNTYSFVTLFDQAGVPRLLVDEKLPTERNRIQGNVRLRWSPEVGFALGLDVGGYVDDWDLRHLAIEPSVESILTDDLRARLWVRVSAQRATKYFRGQATAIDLYQTQDGDLGSFTMLSPGLELTLRLPEWVERAWILRLGVFGFYRTDGIFALGGHSGVTTSW